MEKLLSIVVPIYNTEKYLLRCIEALINQTYKNIEILLINDGSTDGSSVICKEYARKDNRIRYFEHQNRGQGYTRARGVAEARGEFIAFCDSDDYMAPQMYELLMNAIVKDGTDISVCQWNLESEDKKHLIKNDIYDSSFYGIKSGVDFAKYLYKFEEMEKPYGYGYANGVVVSPWNKIYKKSLLDGFKSSGYIGEDEEMNDFILSKPNVKVSVIKDELYYWCINNDSTTHQPFSNKRWHFFKMLNKRASVYSDTYIVSKTHKLICNLFIEYYFKGRAVNVHPPKEIVEIFKSSRHKLLSDGNCPFKMKVRLLLFSLSPKTYKRRILNS